MMEAIRSSEASVLTRAIRHNIPEDGVLHSPRRENLKSYRLQGVQSAEAAHNGDGSVLLNIAINRALGFPWVQCSYVVVGAYE
jgi:hypothetical protein